MKLFGNFRKGLGCRVLGRVFYTPSHAQDAENAYWLIISRNGLKKYPDGSPTKYRLVQIIKDVLQCFVYKTSAASKRLNIHVKYKLHRASEYSKAT